MKTLNRHIFSISEQSKGFVQSIFAHLYYIRTRMINEEKWRQYMKDTTKLALEASLKNMMAKKSFSRITIQDITDDCGISRMAFYYHFKDIYDLLEWSSTRDARKAMDGNVTSGTWQKGLESTFEIMVENRELLLNVFQSIPHERIERYFYGKAYALIYDLIEEKYSTCGLKEEDKVFIADFFKYCIAGIFIQWIRTGMKEDYHVIEKQLETVLMGSVDHAVINFVGR